MKFFDVFIFKAETMCSNYVRPARPNSLRSWTWWAWPPSQCMSEDCKKLCRNGFRIQVSLSIPLFFYLLHFPSCCFSIARRDSTLIAITQFFNFEPKMIYFKKVSQLLKQFVFSRCQNQIYYKVISRIILFETSFLASSINSLSRMYVLDSKIGLDKK